MFYHCKMLTLYNNEHYILSRSLRYHTKVTNTHRGCMLCLTPNSRGGMRDVRPRLAALRHVASPVRVPGSQNTIGVNYNSASESRSSRFRISCYTNAHTRCEVNRLLFKCLFNFSENCNYNFLRLF